MAPTKVKFTIKAFYGDEEIELPFPEHWNVQVCRMAGEGRPALTPDQIRASLANPIGSPRLRDLAQGKKDACILFDDLPKPTRTSEIVPYVIEELHAGGITDEHIRFICAPGTHRPLTGSELTAKLGQDIIEKYMVYNHNIYENLVFKGNTSRGTPVWVNREYDSCDLRIGIGSPFPHASAGFGGGAKMILPGIAGIETVEYHHKSFSKLGGLMKIEGNVFREDLEEAGRLADLHFKCDVVMNEKRHAIALFCGDFVAEHRAAVALAREVYSTPIAKDVDIVVSNAYPDEPQMARAHRVIKDSLKEGGDAVVLLNSGEGQVLHQFTSRYGTNYGGRNYTPGGRFPNLAKASQVFLMTPILSKYDREEAGPEEKIVPCKEWSDVLAHLIGRHGAGTKVAIYPYAALQIPEEQ